MTPFAAFPDLPAAFYVSAFASFASSPSSTSSGTIDGSSKPGESTAPPASAFRLKAA